MAEPILLNCSGNPDTDPPFVKRSPIPSKIIRVPNVISIATQPTYPIRYPLTIPVKREIPIIIRIPSIVPATGLALENSDDMKNPATIADSIEPVMMDKFIPPVKTAAIMASAIKPNSGI